MNAHETPISKMTSIQEIDAALFLHRNNHAKREELRQQRNYLEDKAKIDAVIEAEEERQDAIALRAKAKAYRERLGNTAVLAIKNQAVTAEDMIEAGRHFLTLLRKTQEGQLETVAKVTEALNKSPAGDGGFIAATGTLLEWLIWNGVPFRGGFMSREEPDVASAYKSTLEGLRNEVLRYAREHSLPALTSPSSATGWAWLSIILIRSWRKPRTFRPSKRK